MQTLIHDMANRVLCDNCTLESWAVQDYGIMHIGLWQELTEQGLLLAGASEEEGGANLDMASIMQLVTLSGYHAAPVPLAETLLSNRLIHLVGQSPLSRPTILAFPASDQRPILGKDGTCQGKLHQVGWAGTAEHILFLVHDETASPKLACLSLPTKEAREELYQDLSVSLTGERVASLDLSGLTPDWIAELPSHLSPEGIAALAALCRSAQMIGAMQRMLELGLDYVMERKQFGRPLAKFQAVQHMLAEAAQHFCASCVITEFAADQFGSQQFALGGAMAKARTSEAVKPMIDSIHQCHGAIGFTREYALQYFSRRLWHWRDDCGNEAFWSAKVGQAICNTPETAEKPLWHQATAL